MGPALHHQGPASPIFSPQNIMGSLEKYSLSIVRHFVKDEKKVSFVTEGYPFHDPGVEFHKPNEIKQNDGNGYSNSKINFSNSLISIICREVTF